MSEITVIRNLFRTRSAFEAVVKEYTAGCLCGDSVEYRKRADHIIKLHPFLKAFKKLFPEVKLTFAWLLTNVDLYQIEFEDSKHAATFHSASWASDGSSIGFVRGDNRPAHYTLEMTQTSFHCYRLPDTKEPTWFIQTIEKLPWNGRKQPVRFNWDAACMVRGLPLELRITVYTDCSAKEIQCMLSMLTDRTRLLKTYAKVVKHWHWPQFALPSIRFGGEFVVKVHSNSGDIIWHCGPNGQRLLRNTRSTSHTRIA